MTVRTLIPPPRGDMLGPLDDSALERLHERVGVIEHLMADLSAQQFPTLVQKLDGVLDLLARRRREHYTVDEIAEMRSPK